MYTQFLIYANQTSKTFNTSASPVQLVQETMSPHVALLPIQTSTVLWVAAWQRVMSIYMHSHKTFHNAKLTIDYLSKDFES